MPVPLYLWILWRYTNADIIIIIIIIIIIVHSKGGEKIIQDSRNK